MAEKVYSGDDPQYASIMGVNFPYDTDEHHYLMLLVMRHCDIDVVDILYKDPQHPNNKPEWIRQLYENTRYQYGDSVEVLAPSYHCDGEQYIGQVGMFEAWGIQGKNYPGQLPHPNCGQSRACLMMPDGKSMTFPRRRLRRVKTGVVHMHPSLIHTLAFHSFHKHRLAEILER